MVKISLKIKATLENIVELYTCHPDFGFTIKIKCVNCGEKSNKWHEITESDTIETKIKQEVNHFMAKCKLCGFTNSLKILEGSNGKFDGEKDEQFQSIVVFECRGLEPIDFDPNTGWIAKVLDSKTIFRNIDLSEKEWSEYDVETKQSVGIYDFQHEFVKIK